MPNRLPGRAGYRATAIQAIATLTTMTLLKMHPIMMWNRLSERFATSRCAL
jgi:hypothetical protein